MAVQAFKQALRTPLLGRLLGTVGRTHEVHSCAALQTPPPAACPVALAHTVVLAALDPLSPKRTHTRGAGDQHTSVHPWRDERDAHNRLLHRTYSSSVETAACSMDEAEYDRLSDDCLESLLDKVEGYVEASGIRDGDIQYTQGVLTVHLGEKGTYVINKQAPNQQIWLSSPVSGPFRYDFINGQWVYSRDGHNLHGKLEEEMSALLGRQVKL